MAKFKLWCTWHCGTWVEIEADSFDEAVNTAVNVNDVPKGEYIDHTFSVDRYASHSGGEQKSVWDEDAEYPMKDWRYEVSNGDTVLGYQDWVKHQREANRE